VDFLRSQPLSIEPRKQWPAGLDGAGDPKGKLGPEGLSGEGRALAVLGDGGWGGLVADEREAAGRGDAAGYGTDLVQAAADLVRAWGPDPAPTWVTCVPSLAKPELVPRFAARLAEALGLPFDPVVAKVHDTPPQAQAHNSAQQLRPAWRSFKVAGEVPAGPVLLVDDLVDSRWTLTVVGFQLRTAGVPAVHPFALARANA
jgi:ATP-dependent DNA helicase RecQ